MRKLFLLIPALILSMMMNATNVTISPETLESDNNIRAALNGTADTIFLNDGEYIQVNQIHLKRNVVLKAVANANPVIRLKYYCDFIDGAKVTFDGVKFDGSVSGQQGFRTYNASTGKELRLKNCEFYGFTKAVVSGDKTEYTMDSCIIDNCYFHNNSYAAINFPASTIDGQQTCYGLKITNSTFANNDATADYLSIVDIRSYGLAETNDIEVLVDHCTFYNNITKNSDYASIGTRIITNSTISNCIFAHSEAYERRATYLYAGSAINCLTYNLTKDASQDGHTWMTTRVNCFTADPLFTDAANDDYTFANNWVTMNISPACGAASDGTDLGAPRWYSNPIVPSSNFIAPYAFVGAKAVITGNISYDDVNDNIYYSDKSANGTAKWKIHATRACNVKATLNMTDGSSSGHIFRVELLDANGNHVDEVAEPAQSSHDGNIDLPNTLAIPAEGDYTVILHNDQSWSSAKINSFTLAYVGGAVVTVPAEELLGTEAVLVNEGSLKVSKLENGDLKYGDNGTPDGEYVYWNINATKRGNMKVTLNVVAPGEGDPSGHEFLVELYSNLSGEPISSSAEASATSGTGARVLPNPINIPATGNYIVKLTNKKQWSSAILHSIQFEYLGGATITVPANELIGEEAVLVDEGHLKVSKLANGDLKYGDNGYPLEEYVYWNINATKYGRMDVTANVVAPEVGDPSSHQFLVEVYANLNESPIATSAEPASTSATGAIALPALNIPATGNYIVKLTNQKQWSSAILHSIEFAYAGGEVVAVPGQILGADALLEKSGSKYMIRTEEGYLKSSNNGSPTTEWAVWNITAEAGTMDVTLNLDPETSSGHNYRVELYEGNELKDYTEELASAEPGTAVHSKGNVQLEKRLVIPANGSYTIKLVNRTQWSSMILRSITFTPYVAPAAIIIDEMDEDNSAFADKVGGDAVNVQLKRTFKGGVYNTICLPFAVSSEKLDAAFGAGAELLYMSGASLEGGVLDLEFSTATSIYQGTPFLIKPVADVENPEFAGVSIVLDDAAGSATSHEGWAADFIGTFIKKDLAANPNNLYLGTDDKLYFSNNDVTIKGLRAYFSVNVPVQAIKRARIVAPNNMPTEIELVGSKNQTLKTIENGQLIIFRDGKKYNVMGIRL